MKITITQGDNPVGQLFQNAPSISSEAEYKKLMIVEELLKIMKEKGINRTVLASRMGVQPSRITSMLNGTNNFTIETLVRAGKAVGAELQQTFAPEGMRVRWSYYNAADTHREFLDLKAQPVHKTRSKFVDFNPLAPNDETEAA